VAIAIATAALVLPAAASAHVEISPSEAPAGKSTGFKLTVEHDCEGAATIGLDVKVPPQVSAYSAKPIPGWKVAASPKGQMIWMGGPHPEGEELALPFRATAYGKMGDQLPFKVIQLCEGGVETAWIQTGGGEAEEGTPAPVLTLTSTRAAPVPAAEGPAGAGATGEEQTVAADPAAAGSEDDSGGIGVGPIIGLVLIVASITAFVVIRRGRRASS